MEDKKFKEIVIQLMKDSRDNSWTNEKIELEYYKGKEKLAINIKESVKDFLNNLQISEQPDKK